jgi:hypothetical protein
MGGDLVGQHVSAWLLEPGDVIRIRHHHEAECPQCVTCWETDVVVTDNPEPVFGRIAVRWAGDARIEPSQAGVTGISLFHPAEPAERFGRLPVKAKLTQRRALYRNAVPAHRPRRSLRASAWSDSLAASLKAEGRRFDLAPDHQFSTTWKPLTRTKAGWCFALPISAAGCQFRERLLALPPPGGGRRRQCPGRVLFGGGVGGGGLLARCRGQGQDLHGVGVLRLEVADAAGCPGHRGGVLGDEPDRFGPAGATIVNTRL